jgi:ATP synthase protein I
MEPSDSGDKSSLKQIGPYLGLGLELAATLLVFIFIGQYLDKRWDTEPWLFLVSAVLGFVIGFFNFFRTISRLTDRDRKGGSKT